jgi:formylglycine-generating enzyme required for sulfatase activity
LVGCGKATDQQQTPARVASHPPEQAPAAVSVPAAEVVVGFAGGVLRETRSVAAFRISRHPTTVAQYRACVQAGACALPDDQACAPREGAGLDGPTYAATGADDVPVTCVGTEQASAFCAWHGGVVAALDQFLVAARGTAPQDFAWGQSPPTCDQHPFGRPADAAASSSCTAAAGQTESAGVAVGLHPLGASPHGLQDVLLTPGEFVRPRAESRIPACAAAFAGCIVRGQRPGAMESAEAVKDGATKRPALTSYGFRCTWSEEKQP